MALSTRISFFRRVSALCLGGLILAASPACAEPFRFPWDPPPRRHVEPPRLTAGEIRDILANEGVQMVGPPQLRGDQAIAIGRDDDGRRMKYTLDAVSGEVLRVVSIGPSERERRREEERRRIETMDLNPPGEPSPGLAPSVGDDNLAIGAPPTLPPAPAASAPPVPVLPPPALPAPAVAKPAAPAPGAPATIEARKPDPADASLSPIKPLRPAGAPRVEPLPQ